MRVVSQLERHANFGVLEVRDMYAKLVSTDKTEVDYDTFCLLMSDVINPKDLFVSGLGSSTAEVPYTRKLYDVFDSNKNNSVPFKQLLCGLSVLGVDTVDDKLQLSFELFAEQGYLGKVELETMLSALYNLYFQHGLEKEVSFFVELIFQDADKNSDGKLSLEEFKKAALKQPFIMKCFKAEHLNDNVLLTIREQKEQKVKEKEDDLLKDPEEWVVM